MTEVQASAVGPHLQCRVKQVLLHSNQIERTGNLAKGFERVLAPGARMPLQVPPRGCSAAAAVHVNCLSKDLVSVGHFRPWNG